MNTKADRNAVSKDTQRMTTKERIILTLIDVLMFAVFFISLRLLPYLQKIGAESMIFVNVSAGLVTMLGLSILALAHSLEVVSDKRSAWIFWGMILLTYLGVVCDNLSWAFEGSTQYLRFGRVLDIGGFLIMPFIMVLFWEYQSRVFLDAFERVRKVRWIVNAAAMADILYILIGTATGFLFYFDEYGRYFEGKGFTAVHIFPAIIIACCVYENLRRKMPLKKKLSLLAFGLVPATSILFSIPLPQYSIIYVVFFTDLVLVYGTVQVKKEQELAKRNQIIAEQDRELAQQEMQIMISQIQPHFLYNTLTAIYRLCATDTALAQKTILDFSSYLRTNMDSINDPAPIPFEKELAHTKTYLGIELLRFGDILNVEYDIAVTDFEIPALTLQPIVENAVKYGVRSREDGGTVTISTKREDGMVYLTVHDDGMGFDVDQQKQDGKSHLGIENTRRRLRRMMGAEMTIDSQPGIGTTVTIVLGGKHETAIGG